MPTDQPNRLPVEPANTPREPTGRMPTSLEVAAFAAPASTSVRPTVRVTSWTKLSEWLTSHRRRSNKDGPGWSPTVYRRDKARGRPLSRKIESVEAVTLAVADVDHGDLDDVAELTAHIKGLGLAGLIYSTFSHTVTTPRVRLAIPFAEPVPAELWRRLWPALDEALFLGLADRAASDPCRMYYLPATPGDETTISERWDGEALDWRALPLADVETIDIRPVGDVGAGPAETVDPDDLEILGVMLSGKHGDILGRLWEGDSSDFDGDESRADMRLTGACAFYFGKDPIRMARVLRASGLYRPRWDGRRGSTTLLGYNIQKAITSCRETYSPSRRHEPIDLADEAPAEPAETAEQIIARLERQLAEANAREVKALALVAAQQTIIRAERRQKQALQATVDGIRGLLAVDSKRLSPTDKLVAIPVIEAVELAGAYGQDGVKIPYSGIAARTGLSESTVGLAMKRLCTDTHHPDSNPAAPFWKSTRHVQREIDGVLLPTTEVTIGAKAEGSAFAAVVAYQPSAERQHGGKRPAGCPEHPSADLIIRSATYCAECSRQIGDVRERLCQQVAAIGPGVDQTVSDGYSGQQLAGIEGDDARAAAMVAIPPPARIEEARVKRLRRQHARVGANPPMPPLWPDDAQEQPPPRCVRPGCAAPCGPGDVLLCVGHRAEASTSAIAGGSE